jgi:hypothetical protein
LLERRADAPVPVWTGEILLSGLLLFVVWTSPNPETRCFVRISVHPLTSTVRISSVITNARVRTFMVFLIVNMSRTGN